MSASLNTTFGATVGVSAGPLIVWPPGGESRRLVQLTVVLPDGSAHVSVGLTAAEVLWLAAELRSRVVTP